MIESDLRQMVLSHFSRAGIDPISVEVRSFPGETIVIVEVSSDYERSIILAEELDQKIEDGFVTVRHSGKGSPKSSAPLKNLHDSRIPNLIELMSARSRTSESQPSLRYVKDVDERVNLAVSPRHHLIFGRRGVGKTALLLEAQRILINEGWLTLWVNVHSLRYQSAYEAFASVGLRICDRALAAVHHGEANAGSARLIEACREKLEEFLARETKSKSDLSKLVPDLQQAVSRFSIQTQKPLYIFLDDIHYLPPNQVPTFLDLLHGITRDNAVWLKVAGIQHQTRWFDPTGSTGLQTGHDAAIIDLDITLEHPERAKKFLQEILQGYVDECGANPIRAFLSAAALDRLVLASGGVPRDFLTLCVQSLQTARTRSNASTVGVQDVNIAAGYASQTKLQELEDDAAAIQGRSQALVEAFGIIREFLLDENQITYFRIDFRDKETKPDEYRLVQALADLRMLHLLSPSVSDPHQAGRRSEVYLLDLSQYSGQRLKQHLRVLDLERGHMVLKKTRSSDPKRVGDTARRLIALFRVGPIFDLTRIQRQLELDGIAR